VQAVQKIESAKLDGWLFTIFGPRSYAHPFCNASGHADATLVLFCATKGAREAGAQDQSESLAAFRGGRSTTQIKARLHENLSKCWATHKA